MKRVLTLGFFLIVLPLYAQVPSSQPASQPSKVSLNWRVSKEKTFPNYKVRILTKDNPSYPLGIEGTRAVITDPSGKVRAEIKSVLIEPDPRQIIEGWVPGTLLDIDKDGLEDLVLQTFSAGAHCCYGFQIYSLGKILKKIGDLKLKDCGERIRLQDLNGDGFWEILTCNASFTYLNKIPYAASPFPPLVFGLEKGKFVNQDKNYVKVFDDDIAEQKKNLQEGKSGETSLIQMVFDYLLSGRETEAWQQFDQLYNYPNKEQRRNEIKERWNKYLGIKPETQSAETKP